MIRTRLCIALLSATVIAFQIALLAVFSLTQWYHFAYMVISIALMGFGASGSLLVVGRDWFLTHYEKVVPAATLMSGALMSSCVALSQLRVVRFDSYLIFSDGGHVTALVLSYLLLTLPFLSAGLAIGAVFVKHTEQIGKLYSANLIGSAVGGGFGLGLLHLFEPQVLPPLTGLFAIIAALFLASRNIARWFVPAAAVSLCLVAFLVSRQPGLVVSEYKDLSRTMQMAGVTVLSTTPSPQGLLHVLQGETLRTAPGLSLTYRGEVPARPFVFNNGDFVGAAPVDSGSLGHYMTNELPYAMNARDRVLVLGAGTGEDVMHAKAHGASRIVAVESHGALSDMLADWLADHDGVEIANSESRAYLVTDTSRFDLIVLPTVGSFGGTSGLFATQEQYDLTVESIEDVWRRLTPTGSLSLTTWMDYPYRRPLRVVATLIEAALRRGVNHPERHLTALRSWGTVTFVLSRSEIGESQTSNVRDLSNALQFDPVLLPGIDVSDRVRFNLIEDDRFFEYVDEIVFGNPTQLYDEYSFRIEPTTDNRPYFSQFIRWRNLGPLTANVGSDQIPFLELGTLMVAVTLIQIALLGIVLILVPLFRIGWTGNRRWWTVVHFGSLGLGFMFIEMVLIQRFTLYFGHPITAVTVVLSVLMLFSGIGSYFSTRLPASPRTIAVASGAIVVLVLTYAMTLTSALSATMSIGIVGKIGVSSTVIGLLAFAMGLPFPLGLKMLSRIDRVQVPWAWGINGCLSVVSTALATLLAIELGFVAVMMLAACAYSFVLVASLVRRA